MLGTTSGQVPKNTGNAEASGADADANSPDTPAGGDLPAPQPAGAPATITWQHPAMIAAGAAVVVAGGVVIYTMGQNHASRRLEEALRQREEQP